MKKTIVCILIVSILLLPTMQIYGESSTKSKAETEASIECSLVKSAVLMEATTGDIIYSKEENKKLIPASVTKIMTLLLVAEAIAEGKIALTDEVKISAFAASMGGSQVFLKEGEAMSVEELLKCTVIASANDAAVALAELVAGSESVFVAMMNKRAQELGMNDTYFENVTGLDDTTENHLTTALDIALMSRELIKHDIIIKYSSLWQDTIRNGEFTLTNTNRLVRFYDGCNGLKTGSTSKAGYCMSATAKRNGMQLIAVVMGAETRDMRNETVRKLLDYGFANYELFINDEAPLEDTSVRFGTKNNTMLYEGEFCKLVARSDASKIEKVYNVPEYITAPVSEKESIGKVEFILNGEKIGETNIFSKDNIEKISLWQFFMRIICNIFKPQ
ncbi:MAG: D-alanyl-D-alanine carboxypeptidase [Clostridia bacterium]|nr:D-alanyl-D-alanine carboxypeptidase [Clostridia bacterium]